jgi:Transaldolase/Fructose-6-phosphate aldolase
MATRSASRRPPGRSVTGGDVFKVHGVASFFVSRIDTAIDRKIDEKLKTAGPAMAQRLKALRGRVAIANAKVAHQRYLQMIETPRWTALAEAGVLPQRLLWLPPGPKTPPIPTSSMSRRDLIGPDTVNTMPPKTVHGRVAPTLLQDPTVADAFLRETDALGLELDGVTDDLLRDGVALFAKAFDDLRKALDHKRRRLGDKTFATAATPERQRSKSECKFRCGLRGKYRAPAECRAGTSASSKTASQNCRESQYRSTQSPTDCKSDLLAQAIDRANPRGLSRGRESGRPPTRKRSRQ